MPLISEVGREHGKVRVLLIGITALLWIGVVLHLFPVYWAFLTSIKNSYETYIFPPTLWPHPPTLIGYKVLFKGNLPFVMELPLIVYIKNTLIMVGAIMAIQIPVVSLAAYGLSKLTSPKWNRILFLYLIGPMLIPAVISLIPRFLLMVHFPFLSRNIPEIPFTNSLFPSLKLINTYWAVILPASYNAFNLLLFKGFFDGIPDTTIQAARLDGASELSIFRRIVVPVSKPIFAVVSYFTFSTAWNDFLWPMMVLKESKWPLPVITQRMQETIFNYAEPVEGIRQANNLAWLGVGQNALMAISILQSIPVFIMFIIFREQLMKGIKLRGFK